MVDRRGGFGPAGPQAATTTKEATATAAPHTGPRRRPVYSASLLCFPLDRGLCRTALSDHQIPYPIRKMPGPSGPGIFYVLRARRVRPKCSPERNLRGPIYEIGVWGVESASLSLWRIGND